MWTLISSAQRNFSCKSRNKILFFAVKRKEWYAAPRVRPDSSPLSVSLSLSLPKSAVRGRSNKYANKKGDGDGTSLTTSTQSELEVSDDESMISDISGSELGGKNALHGVSLLDEKSNQDEANR
jgi:hypothetical protein